MYIMYILFLGGNKMETYNRDLHTHTVKEYEVKKDTAARDFSLGLVAGLTVGSIIGLLVAPKSGKVLQEELAEKVEVLKSKSIESYTNQIKNAESFKEKVAAFKADLSNEHQSELELQKKAIKAEVNDDTLKQPDVVVNKALTPNKDEALLENKKTKHIADNLSPKNK